MYIHTYIHTLPYITLHYITLHESTLHDITLHDITLHNITLHNITLHESTLHDIITLHYITSHYSTLHYLTLHYITLHYIALHYISSSFLPILQGRTYSMPKWLGNFRELRRPRSGEFFVSYSLPSIPFLLARTLSTARVLPQRRSFLRAIFDDGV